MLLFCACGDFTFRVADENIRAFPISIKRETLGRSTFRQVPKIVDFSESNYLGQISKNQPGSGVVWREDKQKL